MDTIIYIGIGVIIFIVVGYLTFDMGRDRD